MVGHAFAWKDFSIGQTSACRETRVRVIDKFIRKENDAHHLQRYGVDSKWEEIIRQR